MYQVQTIFNIVIQVQQHCLYLTVLLQKCFSTVARIQCGVKTRILLNTCLCQVQYLILLYNVQQHVLNTCLCQVQYLILYIRVQLQRLVDGCCDVFRLFSTFSDFSRRFSNFSDVFRLFFDFFTTRQFIKTKILCVHLKGFWPLINNIQVLFRQDEN